MVDSQMPCEGRKKYHKLTVYCLMLSVYSWSTYRMQCLWMMHA